jgi:hypothetical protein
VARSGRIRARPGPCTRQAAPTTQAVTRARALALGIAVAGVGVRAYLSSDSLYSQDLGEAYAVAHDVAHGVAFPIVGGRTTWGGRVPLPGYGYVLAPSLLFTDSPRALVLWGVLLSGAGLLLFVLLLAERYGDGTAIVGALVLAFAPWAVATGDGPWSPKLVVPAVALLLYAMHRVVAAQRSPWIAAVPAALVLQAQVYPNLPVTLAMVAAVWAIARPRLHGRWLAIGIAASLATVLPTAIWLFAHGVGALGRLFSVDRPFDRVHETAEAAYQVLAFGSADVSYLLARGWWNDFDVLAWRRDPVADLFGDPTTARFAAATVVAAAGAWAWAAFAAVRGAWRRPVRAWDPMAVALVAGAIAALAVAGLGERGHRPHYMYALVWIALLPSILLFGSIARGRAGRVAVAAWLALSVAGNLHVLFHYYRETLPPYGLSTAVATMRTIERFEAGRPFRLVHRHAKPGLDRTAKRLYPGRWNDVRTAPVAWHLVRADRRDRIRALARRPGARTFRVPRAVLVRVP